MFSRFKEPSTWASIAMICGIFGFNVDSETLQLITQVGTGLAALVGVFMPEQATA